MTCQHAYLLDMDGTIVDNMAYHNRTWVAFMAQHGLTIDAQEFFERTAGKHAREIIREFLGARWSDAECDALVAEKEAAYRALYGPHIAPLPGLLDFIAAARAQRIALAVATSGPNANIAFTLDGLDLRRQFDAVIGAADVKRGKPWPDVFLKAAEACGARPADCIVFEDAPLGVEAARNAGMRAVVLTTTLSAAHFAAYDNVIAHVADFTALASNLFAAGSR
jgi:beta-phosphoglucomutase family hydrolase